MRPVFFAVILAVAFYVTNFNIIPQKGIIAEDKSVMMSAPSSGSNVISFADKGNRITVKGKKDVWYKVIWEDQEVFIRENNILVIGDFDQESGESFSFLK